MSALAEKLWYVYLIECTDNSIYTGISVDVAARYAQHASGKGARYTRAHPPKRLLYVAPYPNRSAALKAEYALRHLSARQKRQLVDGTVQLMSAEDGDPSTSLRMTGAGWMAYH